MDKLNNSTRILITGSNGFLGQKFCEIIQDKGYETLGLSKSANRNPYLHAANFQQVELSDFSKLQEVLEAFEPTHILHTAAITSVEACEENKDLTQIINVDLTAFLGKYSKQNRCHLTFISTDFVFDGKNGLYKETDLVNPVNAYGKSKVDAENLLINMDASVAILRTILVYGAIPDKGRSNLVLWAKGQLEKNNPIKVVRDQWRMPTFVDDLAEACVSAMQKQANGIFHISGNEMMSIEEAVYKLVVHWNFDKNLVSAIAAKEIGQDQNRPQRTGFILDKAKTELGYKPTPFIVSLQKIEQQLNYYNG